MMAGILPEHAASVAITPTRRSRQQNDNNPSANTRERTGLAKSIFNTALQTNKYGHLKHTAVFIDFQTGAYSPRLERFRSAHENFTHLS